MAYILVHTINYRHYKTEVIKRIKEKCKLENQTQVSGAIVDCWMKVAKACKVVFKSLYSQNDYILLEKTLEEAADILLKVFLPICIKF